MIIAVVAANGRTGREIVRTLASSGYHVRAGMRTVDAELFSGVADVKVVQCDALDAEQVEQLVAGCDAVVSAIGHGPGNPARLQTDAMRNVVTTMRRYNITRLISLTGTGVRYDGDRPSLVDRIANVIIARIDPERIADGKAHAEYLATTQLDWTIIRVLKLAPSFIAARTSVRLDLAGPAELLTSRRTVAHAVVQLLEASTEREQFVRQAPIIIR